MLHGTIALHATFWGMDHGTAPVYSLADGVWAVPTLGTIDGVALNSGVWVSHHQVSWARQELFFSPRLFWSQDPKNECGSVKHLSAPTETRFQEK